MADKKISDLTEVVTPATTDFFEITNAGASKKVSLANVKATMVLGWQLIAAQVAAGATNYDFTGLAAYSSIEIVFDGVTLSSSGLAVVRVSTDNGATFLAASGDYLGISGVGVSSNLTEIQPYTTNATAARYGVTTIQAFNVAGARKAARTTFFSVDSRNIVVINTTAALNAVRVIATAGNLSGGTIGVFGRY